MTQYERIIALDEHRLTEIGKSTKNILEIYNAIYFPTEIEFFDILNWKT